jgi:hypothetical protein
MYSFQPKWINLSKDEAKKDKGSTDQKNETGLTNKSSKKDELILHQAISLVYSVLSFQICLTSSKVLFPWIKYMFLWRNLINNGSRFHKENIVS